MASNNKIREKQKKSRIKKAIWDYKFVQRLVNFEKSIEEKRLKK